MEAWDLFVQTVRDILAMILQRPATGVGGLILLSGALVVGWVVLRITARAVGMARTSPWLALLVSVAGLALILLGLTAVRLLLPAAATWVLVAVAIVICLLLVLPLIGFLMKGNYLVALFAWLITLGAVAGWIVLAGAAWDAVVAGAQNAEKARKNKQTQDQIFEGRPPPARNAR
jgi:hypothetical protein